MRFGALLLVVCTASVPTSAATQDSTPVAAGEWVRIMAPTLSPRSLTGTLLNIERERVTMTQDPGPGQSFVVPLAEITRFEVQRLGPGSQVHRGAALGMVLGGLALGAVGYAATRDDEYFPGLAAVVTVPIGIGLGALTGGLIGRTIKAPTWHRIDSPRLVGRPRLRPQHKK